MGTYTKIGIVACLLVGCVAIVPERSPQDLADYRICETYRLEPCAELTAGVKEAREARLDKATAAFIRWADEVGIPPSEFSHLTALLAPLCQGDAALCAHVEQSLAFSKNPQDGQGVPSVVFGQARQPGPGAKGILSVGDYESLFTRGGLVAVGRGRGGMDLALMPASDAAVVFVDDHVFTNRQPIRNVESGYRRIKVVSPGYGTVEGYVRVDPERVTSVEVALVEAKGTLLVLSDPAGAVVYVDDAAMGVTPLRVEGLPAGGLELRVLFEGREWSRTVEMAGDARLERASF